MLEEIKNLIQSKGTCVLATVSGEIPHCSLMSYITNDEGNEIYMVTKKKTKKFYNLVRNPRVSLMIDTREEDSGTRRGLAKALTVNGLFQRIEDVLKSSRIRGQILKRHPYLAELMNDPGAEIFCIRVESIQLVEGPLNSYFETIA